MRNTLDLVIEGEFVLWDVLVVAQFFLQLIYARFQ